MQTAVVELQSPVVPAPCSVLGGILGPNVSPETMCAPRTPSHGMPRESFTGTSDTSTSTCGTPRPWNGVQP